MRVAIALALSFSVAGCTATTTFQSANEGSVVAIRTGASAPAPRTETFPTTSFGNYEFKVTADGAEPFYGILPLKFNGGYLAADILFFAPGMFFNLREVYPYYEFDAERGVVKYRLKPTDGWTEYRPLDAEAERARAHFERGT